MTPQDQAGALSVQPATNIPPGAKVPGDGAQPAAEPTPAETRRLPKANARPAPVLALLRARWPWLVVAALLGTMIGLLLGAAPESTATSRLRILGISDAFRLKQVGQTAQADATSVSVISRAAASTALATARGGQDPREYAADLASRTVAVWPNDTDIVDITVSNSDGEVAIAETNAVMQAVLDNNTELRNSQTAQVTAAIQAALKQNGLSGSGAANDPEAARAAALGEGLGQAQLQAALQAAAITKGQAATVAVSGTSPITSAALGGTGGLLLGALAALLVGAGRRRVRNPVELRALAPELSLKSTTQAGEVAGRLLESGHTTLVVLSLPSTPSSTSRFAAAVANHLRTHGSSVTLVNAIVQESSDASMVLPDEVWVLRRDIRQDVSAYFSTDLLVVACTAEPEAVGLISGQSDLMAVVVAKEGRSTLQQIWDTVGAVEAAEPIVVLAP